ncbi:MAG: glycosyltransferase family 2 protein, partial [Bacteroidaceae bacterium]|nr:glycosyltransferase family 2 protein [Bacteroidaceae bacterium]
RFWLDALASVQFFLTGQWGSFCAVWRARRAFRHMRSEFEQSRRENLAATVLSPVPEQSGFSLLWQYYVRRRRRWCDLPQ